MQEIKVGDVVIFYFDGNKPAHKGQVVEIIGDDLMVYCQTESEVYKVKKEKCKKIQ